MSELFNHYVTKVSDTLGSLLNGEGKEPPWDYLAIIYHLAPDLLVPEPGDVDLL